MMIRLYCLISTVPSPENIAAEFTRALSPTTHQLKTLTLKSEARRKGDPQIVKKTAVPRLDRETMETEATSAHER